LPKSLIYRTAVSEGEEFVEQIVKPLKFIYGVFLLPSHCPSLFSWRSDRQSAIAFSVHNQFLATADFIVLDYFCCDKHWQRGINNNMAHNLLMQNFVTKPLASLVSSGMILLPIVASSTYGVANTSINSKNSTSVNISTPTSGELQAAANCNYSDPENLVLTANQFISKCCKATIRQQFPGQYLNKTLTEILIAQNTDRAAKTAYKLLNDGRFRK
jgi:hypothetical protein